MSKKSLFFLASIFCLQGFCYAPIINVGVTKPIKSLKEAINIAKNGDKIVVDRGVYKENNISIDKSIHIVGEKETVIDCEMQSGITVSSVDSVVVENLTIKNIGTSFIKDLSAIKIIRSKNFKIIDNTLRNVFFGIFVEKSEDGVIRNNDIRSKVKEEFNSGNGIHLWYCNNIDISNNNIDNLRDGIYLEFTNESKISGNTSKNNLRYGLHFMFSNNDEYSNNWFENNGAGVAVMFSRRIVMYENTFYKNWGAASYGLLLKEISDGKIYDNIFEENTIGINAEGSNRIRYNNNNFKANGWAVKIRGACYENHFVSNNFLFNTFDVSYNGEINGNIFDKNYWSKYTGYDMDKNGVGDVPYRPVKLFSYVVNRTPETIILLRSLFVDIINFSEKVSPIFTPNDLVDKSPLMKKRK